MSVPRSISGLARAAVLAASVLAFGGPLYAQNTPTPTAIETAKQIVTLKGGLAMFDALIPGVIEQGKGMFLQQNPNLQKDLNEVAAKLRAELAPRLAEVNEGVAKAYATHFTEQELKDILAFYQTPLGKKVINEEPKALDQSMTFAQDWAIKFSDEVVAKIRAEMKKRGHEI
jgi:hypothetical protein